MTIEDFVYSAEEHGKRDSLLNEVSKLKKQSPSKELKEIYEDAYQRVMNT